jgi:hypothetical protein
MTTDATPVWIGGEHAGFGLVAVELGQGAGHNLRSRRLRAMVEGESMMRRFMLLALALGCGGDSSDCDHPLAATDDDGNPWPAYSLAAAQLADCTQLEGYYDRRSGSCSDGKRFLAKGTGFVGDTSYFDGETLVGRIPWSDVIRCDSWRYGDTSCEEVDVEEIRCPIGP